MRQILSISKLFLLCLFATYFFLSCQAPRVITIGGGNLANDSLQMVNSQQQPAYDFYVHAGDNIKWKLGKPVTTVKGFKDLPIKLSKSQYDIFADTPHQRFLSRSWIGKIKDSINLKGIKEEYYNIIWKGSDNKNHTFDPRIIINP